MLMIWLMNIEIMFLGWLKGWMNVFLLFKMMIIFGKVGVGSLSGKNTIQSDKGLFQFIRLGLLN